MPFNSFKSLTQAPLLPGLPDSHTKGLLCSWPVLKANLVLRLHLVHIVVSVLTVTSVSCFAS